MSDRVHLMVIVAVAALICGMMVYAAADLKQLAM
jgi:hypothetical protein